MRRGMKIQRGFTLVEMIVVIVITGILGGIVAVFIKAPVQGYVDSERRAEMVDTADTALRRIGRDLRTAVPNSVRVPTPAGSTYIEFLPTSDGGRYRADPTSGNHGCDGVTDDEEVDQTDALSFDKPDTCFEIIGPAVTFTAGDQIVVGSVQSDGSLPYQQNAIRRQYNGAPGAANAVIVNSSVALPAYAQLTGQRFDVVPGDQQAVTYACVGTLTTLDANGDGQAQLVRYWHYDFQPAQPAPGMGGATSAILANNVSTCRIVYDTFNQRNGLVAVTLGITRGNESVQLYHEIHVNNIP